MDADTFHSICKDATSSFDNNDCKTILESYGLNPEDCYFDKYSLSLRLQAIIKSVLVSDEGVSILYVKEDLLIKSYLNADYKNSFLVFNQIFLSVGLGEKIDEDNEKWTKAIKISEILRGMNEFVSRSFDDDYFNDREKNIAGAIKFFKGYGLNPTVKNGRAVFNSGEKNVFRNIVDHRGKKLGANFLVFLFDDIKKGRFFDYARVRFKVNYNPESRKPIVPYGYAIKLALKFLQYGGRKKNYQDRKIYRELNSILLNYIVMSGLQEYGKFESLNLKGEKLIDYFNKIALIDQVFNIDQVSHVYLRKMLTGIYSGVLLRKVDGFLKIIELFWEMDSGEMNVSFARETLYMRLAGQVDKHLIDEFLAVFSIEAKNLNKGFYIPEDHESVNFDRYPLIEVVKDNFLFLNANISGMGFYHALNRYVKNSGVDVKRFVGDRVELFLKDFLEKSGISFLNHEEYNFPRSLMTRCSIKKNKGQCDFIIESDRFIVFIEVKRKLLTLESVSGAVPFILDDLAKSFFHAQVQAGWHEVMLREYGKIKFLSGKELHLRGREIERVAVSLFDYHGLTDTIFVNDMLSGLINSEVRYDPTYSVSDENINKWLNVLRLQFNLDSMPSLIPSRDSNPLADMRFFSVLQILLMLDYSTDNESFVNNLLMTKRVSTGRRSWYDDFDYIRYIKSYRK